MNGGQVRKPTQRPSQDSQTSNYGTYQTRGQESIQGNARVDSRPQLPIQNGQVIFDGYRKDIINNFETEKPHVNPMSTVQNDPIQVHLLVETALGDSKEFEILPQEEVDELKKQTGSLTKRIEQTRQNLAIQSKYRDAAISMAKLYSNSDKKQSIDSADGRPRQRRSLLGSRNSNSEQVREAEVERIASEKKCEELTQELWNLERRLMEPQRRLLQHTAGILQMTHKGPLTAPKQNGVAQQGIPGSPESLYTYSNARSSLEPPAEEDLFDDRSLYRMFDRIDGSGFGGQHDSWDLLGRGSSTVTNQTREQISEQMKTIATTEQKLESLNARLREVIVKASPQRQSYGKPPRAPADEMSAVPGKLLSTHLDYLEQGIKAIDTDQMRLRSIQKRSEIETEETIEEINREIRALLLPFDATRPVQPPLTGKSLTVQLNYLQNSIGAVEGELQRAASIHSNNMEAQQDSLNQVEAVLTGLWDIIQSGEEDIRRRKRQARQALAKDGIQDDGSDLSADDNSSIEAFTLQAFSSKVQQIFSQVTNLKEQKKVLQRQIKQQRELNNKEDSAKVTQLSQLESDLKRTKQDQLVAEKEAKELQAQLMQVMERLDDARRESTQRGLEKARREEGESVAIQALEKKVAQRNDEIIQLEEQLQSLKEDHSAGTAETQSRLAMAGNQVQTLTTKLTQAEKDSRAWKQRLEDKEAELDTSNMEVARLQTEVTIARAELDGAYGSRAQRAAQVAANPVIQKELDDLSARNRTLQTELQNLKSSGVGEAQTGLVQQLKQELAETIEEYEVMTKASIEWEKERESLEREVDGLREEREALETRLADEQVRWLGVKSPSAAGGAGAQDVAGVGMSSASGGGVVGAGATSTMVLKNEFKRMMRDTRAENAKALRAEQTERRRLEEEVRALKKLQGPGKSGLSLAHNVSS